ncbi:MAG TPA: glycosyltransferase family 4 protein, partial [Acidobacteriaceae bacterium]|nr:glycosyltransferase family 4 protein [Acidobacteriaceae bacterium]
ALSYMYRHIDIALFVGKSNCEYFETYGVTPDRLLWAPHSVENERFSDPTGRLEREAARWRARLGIRADVPVALFGGKLEKKKSPDLLLRSFLAHARPEAQLIFVGTGELEGELRRTAGSDSRIHFLGFQNQSVMPVVYRLADVYVLPSGGPGETWGLAVNEAMASERPVIVSDRVGCAADLVIDGETGFTFPHGDEIALGEALQRILLDTTRSRSLGAAASRLIERWSLLEQAARIEKAVEIALAPRRIPSR